jgi:type II secretory pathway pseudopilin PulG
MADYLARVARVGARPWAAGMEQRARVPWLEGSAAIASPPSVPPAMGTPPVADAMGPQPAVGATPRTASRSPGHEAATRAPAQVDAPGPAPAPAGRKTSVVAAGAAPATAAPGIAATSTAPSGSPQKVRTGPAAGQPPTGPRIASERKSMQAAAVSPGTTGSTKVRAARAKRTAVARHLGQVAGSAAATEGPRDPTPASAPERLAPAARSPVAPASPPAPAYPGAPVEQSRWPDPAPRLAGRWRIDDATAKPDGSTERPAALGANAPPSPAARPPVARDSTPAGASRVDRIEQSRWPDPVPRRAGRWRSDDATATSDGGRERPAEIGASVPPRMAAAPQPGAWAQRTGEERTLPPRSKETVTDGPPILQPAVTPRAIEATRDVARSTKWQPREDRWPPPVPVSKPAAGPVPPPFQLDVGRIEVLVVNQPAPTTRSAVTPGNQAAFRQLSPALARFRLRR